MAADNPFDMLLLKLQTSCTLSSLDIAALRSLPFQMREYSARVDILREGDRPSQCCLVVAGFLARYNTVEGGSRQILSFHCTGDMPDLQSLYIGTMDHNLATLSRTQVTFIKHEYIRELIAERPQVSAVLWRETLVDAAIFRQWVVNNGRRDARSRVAHLICEQAMRLQQVGLGDRTGFPAFLTQAQLSDATGISVVHTNRMLQSLRKDGLTGEWDGTRINILDWDGLAAAGEFGPGYLHLGSTG